MICPFCSTNDDKVIDSRPTEGGRVIRRRRRCLGCDKRFSTYERVEQASRLAVVKRDGSRTPFDSDKVLAGVVAACGKRNISEDSKRELVEAVEEELHHEFEREVESRIIGERVMIRLRNLDAVAYIRFTSEHLGIQNIEDLRKEVNDFMERPPEVRDQQTLFKPA